LLNEVICAKILLYRLNISTDYETNGWNVIAQAR